MSKLFIIGLCISVAFFDDHFSLLLITLIQEKFNIMSAIYDVYKNYSFEWLPFLVRLIPYILLTMTIYLVSPHKYIKGICWGGLLGIVISLTIGFMKGQAFYLEPSLTTSTGSLFLLSVPIIAVPFSFIFAVLGGVIQRFWRCCLMK